MKMKLHFVLNQINLNIFVKMTKTKGFRNPKNCSKDKIKVSIKKKINLKLKSNVLLEIRKWTILVNTDSKPLFFIHLEGRGLFL
jgi:hypothetical protein